MQNYTQIKKPSYLNKDQNKKISGDSISIQIYTAKMIFSNLTQ